MRKIIFVIVGLSAILYSCTPDEGPSGENLYDGINKDKDADSVVMLNPQTIEGLHQQIFSVKCATSGCHDGSFEPDFRTIQSSYTTLVRANVVKQVDPFSYRVEPGNKEKSWLWERITTDDAVLGKMPLYSDALSQEELDNIAAWIDNGAKDVNGNTLPLPDYYPVLYGFYVVNGTDTTIRYDDLREPNDFTGAMKVPKNTEIDIWIGVLDEETDINALKMNELWISKDKDDFSNKTVASASFVFPPLIVSNYFGPNSGFYFFYKTTINTGDWNPGEQIYLRYMVKDGGHTDPISLPSANAEWYWKNRYSILISD